MSKLKMVKATKFTLFLNKRSSTVYYCDSNHEYETIKCKDVYIILFSFTLIRKYILNTPTISVGLILHIVSVPYSPL